MNFQDNLSAMPDISHLSGLDVLDAQGKVLHHIPAVQGKLGSLKLYNTLAQKFDNRLDSAPPNAACPCLPNIPPMRGPIRANIQTSTCCSRSKRKIWYCNCALSKPDLDLSLFNRPSENLFSDGLFSKCFAPNEICYNITIFQLH